MCTISRQKFKRHYLKNNRLFLFFYCISEMCMKFKTFWKKKNEYPSLTISEIMDFERGGYLNV